MATFELFKDRQGQFRWRLKASNGKIIADGGEGYINKADCRHGIELVKSEAAAAEVTELPPTETETKAKAKTKTATKVKA